MYTKFSALHGAGALVGFSGGDCDGGVHRHAEQRAMTRIPVPSLRLTSCPGEKSAEFSEKTLGGGVSFPEYL